MKKSLTKIPAKIIIKTSAFVISVLNTSQAKIINKIDVEIYIDVKTLIFSISQMKKETNDKQISAAVINRNNLFFISIQFS